MLHIVQPVLLYVLTLRALSLSNSDFLDIYINKISSSPVKTLCSHYPNKNVCFLDLILSQAHFHHFVCFVTFKWPLPSMFLCKVSWRCSDAVQEADGHDPGVEFVPVFVFAFTGPDGSQLIVNLIFGCFAFLSCCCDNFIQCCLEISSDQSSKPLDDRHVKKEWKISFKHTFFFSIFSIR